jgi:hypothetical protein
MTSLAVVPTSRPRHRRSPDVGALVADLRREHGNKQASNALFELLLEDEAVARAVAAFVVEKLAAAAPRRRVMPTAKERAEHQAVERVAVKEIAAKVKAALVLDLPVTLVSGEQKQLRYMTKAELNQLGGLYVQLGARLETSSEMCGERWTEGEVKALLASGGLTSNR